MGGLVQALDRAHARPGREEAIDPRVVRAEEHLESHAEHMRRPGIDHAAMTHEINTKGKSARFKKVGRGLFAAN